MTMLFNYIWDERFGPWEKVEKYEEEQVSTNSSYKESNLKDTLCSIPIGCSFKKVKPTINTDTFIW